MEDPCSSLYEKLSESCSIENADVESALDQCDGLGSSRDACERTRSFGAAATAQSLESATFPIFAQASLHVAVVVVVFVVVGVVLVVVAAAENEVH